MMEYRTAVLAASVGLVASLTMLAAPAHAGAARPSPQRRLAIRASLLRAVHRHPGILGTRAFYRRAALVDFTLPLTIRLRQGPNPAVTNVNNAVVDLGASLGQREVDLGGQLPAELKFHDSFDGGALGNVDIELRPGGDLVTSSIPLLWNPQVSSLPGTHWYDAGSATGSPGCQDYTNAGAVPSIGTATTTVGRTLDSPLAASGFHGVPYFATQPAADQFATTGNTGLIAGTVESFPGADDVSLLHADHVVGDPNGVGGSFNPFPYGASARPGGFSTAPTAADAVLRTAPLHLHVAAPGTQFIQSGPPSQQDGNGPQGSQNIVLGRSGGTANLFGNIPGKSTGIQVTVNFETKITSILRSVDPDRAGLVSGGPYDGASFNCRQFWTGTVQNYLNDITLIGSLHISPAITTDGKLRIAKVSLTSDQDWDVSLAACLLPYSTFSSSPAVAPLVPADELSGQSATAASALNPQPVGVKCNTPPTPLVAQSGVPGLGPLATEAISNADGSQVSVMGSISVPQVEADVLIGDAN
jgi:hypothetical protein